MATALITGASSGIGKELAFLLAEGGYDIIVVARGQEALTSIAAKIERDHKRRATAIAIDLGAPGAVARLMDELGDRQIDLLVNNAGRGDFGLFGDVEPDAYEATIALNITALTSLVRAVLPQMLARNSGRIVNIASTASFQQLPWMAVYGATKAYVLSLTEAIAYEYRKTGVKFLAVCPGATDTGFASAAAAEDSANFAGGGVATPRQVASYVAGLIRSSATGVAVHGLKNRIESTLARVSPRSMVLPAAEKAMRPR